MCQFLSAIVSRTGEIYWNQYTDSHSDLISINKLKEGKTGQNFVRVEFSPVIGADSIPKYEDVDSYSLRVDESFTPEWFDEEMAQNVRKFLSGCVKRMILKDVEIEVLVDGAWIICGKTRIHDVKCSARIVSIVSGAVNFISGGTVDHIWGGMVNRIRGGTVNYIWGGTVNNISGGTVDYICGGTVNYISGGTVDYIRGGTVNYISGGTVNNIWGGTVNNIVGGTVDYIRGGTVNNDLRGI